MGERLVVDDAITQAATAFGGFGEVASIPARAIVSGAPELAAATGLIVRSVTRVDESLLASAPNLRFVGTATSGSDHLDRAALARRGIAVADASGCNALAVAEWVIAALGKLRCRLDRGTIGVVGVGHVGSQLVRLLRASGWFDEVLCCDPPRARAGDRGEAWVELDELWARASVVSFHVPLTRDGSDPTDGLVDATRPALGESKLLINTSRGAVVRNSALSRTDVRAWVLDVFEGEPELAWEQVLGPRAWLLSPHVAGYSLDAKLRATTMIHAALANSLGREPSFVGLDSLPRTTIDLRGTEDATELFDRAVDLRGDDQRLHELFDSPAAARASGFEELRRGYRLRREFAGCVLAGEPAPEVTALARALGFAL